jgi:ketosteroid isomerase-like protein
MTTSLPPIVAEYLAAVNAFDVDAIVATFAPDAYVNDARREIRGLDAIRRWVEKEMVGDHVTMEPLEVVDHYGDTIVRSRYDGTYDKTNLPAELVMSDYFSVRDGRIVSLAVIRNQPSPY